MRVSPRRGPVRGGSGIMTALRIPEPKDPP